MAKRKRKRTANNPVSTAASREPQGTVPAKHDLRERGRVFEWKKRGILAVAFICAGARLWYGPFWNSGPGYGSSHEATLARLEKYRVNMKRFHLKPGYDFYSDFADLPVEVQLREMNRWPTYEELENLSGSQKQEAYQQMGNDIILNGTLWRFILGFISCYVGIFRYRDVWLRLNVNINRIIKGVL